MNGKGTLYEKIASDYVQAIKHGAYPLESRLPSVRETAAFYQCNPLTVLKAYELLIQEGYIEAVSRSGYRVQSLEPPNSKLTQAIESLLEDYSGDDIIEEVKRQCGSK